MHEYVMQINIKMYYFTHLRGHHTGIFYLRLTNVQHGKLYVHNDTFYSIVSKIRVNLPLCNTYIYMYIYKINCIMWFVIIGFKCRYSVLSLCAVCITHRLLYLHKL